MYTRMVRAFVGIGSVDTVVAPDSALVGLGVAGPVATPSAAACLPLQVHDLRRVSVIFRQDRLARSSRYLYNEILAFYNNVLYEVCPGHAPGRVIFLHFDSGH